MKMKNVFASVMAVSALTVCITACSAKAASSHDVFGDKFDKEVFNLGEYEILTQDDDEIYSYYPSKDIYALSTSTENGSYTTLLDKNGDACFIANLKSESEYIDYPNDGKGAELRNSETLELVDEAAEEIKNDGVWQTADVDSTYTANPQEKGELRGSALTEKDALKIQALSVIHEDSVETFEDIKFN